MGFAVKTAQWRVQHHRPSLLELSSSTLKPECRSFQFPALGLSRCSRRRRRRVRDLFEQARQHATAIVFIDELDALGRARGTFLPGGGGHLHFANWRAK